MIKLNKDVYQRIVLLIQIAAVALFLGRAWQHIIWDAPFRTVLWDENWMKGIVEPWFGMTWDAYITSAEMDQKIQNAIGWVGIFYLLCAFIAVRIKQWFKVGRIFMILGSISLMLLAILYCKERFYSIGQFLEYSLQFLTPVFLVLVVKNNAISKRLLFFMKLAIAFTFICHGLYAVGYYPRPGYFTQMTMNILPVSEDTAIQFLVLAAILDFVIGIGIFLPFRISKWIILYAIFWGFMTSIARTWAFVEMDYLTASVNQWLHETIYRFPHFIIPLVVFYIEKNKQKENATNLLVQY